jgi:pimeloyl-ACP methyl ester carboxylesterase
MHPRPKRDALPYLEAGSGPAFVVLHGFGLTPATYSGLARALSARCRVVIPALFDVRGRWTYDRELRSFAATLEALKIDRAILAGHSFGGGIELGYATEHPQRIRQLVFADTLAASRHFRLAAEAFHPLKAMRMATAASAKAFASSAARHPVTMSRAGFWAFSDDRTPSAQRVAESGIPSHVLWANRDTILSRRDGRRFARELHASFTVARAGGLALDHDWMYRHPDIFVHHLEHLGVLPKAEMKVVRR